MIWWKLIDRPSCEIWIAVEGGFYFPWLLFCVPTGSPEQTRYRGTLPRFGCVVLTSPVPDTICMLYAASLARAEKVLLPNIACAMSRQLLVTSNFQRTHYLSTDVTIVVKSTHFFFSHTRTWPSFSNLESPPLQDSSLRGCIYPSRHDDVNRDGVYFGGFLPI
jgi:hypothetical protein